MKKYTAWGDIPGPKNLLLKRVGPRVLGYAWAAEATPKEMLTSSTDWM